MNSNPQGLSAKAERARMIADHRALRAPREEVSTDAGETCGPLCKCAVTGTCSVLSADEAQNGCTRPSYARDSAEGQYIVWGYGTGASFPGVPSKTCACGKHKLKADARGVSRGAAAARAEMLAHHNSLNGRT